MFKEIMIAVVDENAGSQAVVLERAIELGIERVKAEDQALGLQRNHIPFRLIRLPDTPQGRACLELAEKIRAVAQFDLIPDNQTQALWMRSVQLYWQARAIRLANLVFQVIRDPLQPGGSLHEILPSQDLENLYLETDADKALYDLLEAGESLIKNWATTTNIGYPFSYFQELFIHILKARFKRTWQDETFSPTFSRPDKKLEKKHYRQWLKFFADYLDDKSLEKKYSQVLMDMGWEGYPMLALRQQKRKPFDKLWKAFLETHRAAVKLIDDDLHLKNSQPYQTKQTNQKAPIQGQLTKDGYIYWT